MSDVIEGGNMWPTYVVGVIRFGLLTSNNVALLYGHGAQLIHSQRAGRGPTDSTQWTQ